MSARASNRAFSRSRPPSPCSLSRARPPTPAFRSRPRWTARCDQCRRATGGHRHRQPRPRPPAIPRQPTRRYRCGKGRDRESRSPLVTLLYPPQIGWRISEVARDKGAIWLPRGMAWEAGVRRGKLHYRDEQGSRAAAAAPAGPASGDECRARGRHAQASAIAPSTGNRAELGDGAGEVAGADAEAHRWPVASAVARRQRPVGGRRPQSIGRAGNRRAGPAPLRRQPSARPHLRQPRQQGSRNDAIAVSRTCRRGPHAPGPGSRLPRPA